MRENTNHQYAGEMVFITILDTFPSLWVGCHDFPICWSTQTGNPTLGKCGILDEKRHISDNNSKQSGQRTPHSSLEMLVTQYGQYTSSPLRNNGLDFMSSSREVRSDRRMVYKHLECLFLSSGCLSLGKYFQPSRAWMGNLWSKDPLPVWRGRPTLHPQQMFSSLSSKHCARWWREVMAARLEKVISRRS